MYKTPPANMGIVLIRFLCAVFMHITLIGEFEQGMKMMKFANNHWWLFRTWWLAFLVGFVQAFVIISVESINMLTLITNNTIMDIIMNFLALVIIADFDNYFISTVEN